MKKWDGGKLGDMLEKKHLHYQDVAEKVGVQKRVVSNWRHGVEPRAERLSKLAAALDCRPEDFYSEVEG